MGIYLNLMVNNQMKNNEKIPVFISFVNKPQLIVNMYKDVGFFITAN